MTTANWSTQDTQVGPFTAVVAADGAVLASGWTSDVDELIPVISLSLRPADLREKRDLGDVTAAVHRYHRGEFDAVDPIVVRQRSGEFLGHTWDVLRTVPAGKSVTYTELAALAGRPDAVRAAASACARNACALFVPCHRVLRVGGAMGGFRWGIDVKRRLLAHEHPA
ncbi:methylated-DNA-[protein]-cysteine S-methyltransferase [Prauserella isguenensis]|uniref:Methylated-DNA-[protein]-cysteine S-methyltransferase n=1 Tax=Prauserella isguenensis TaxID=1470180 RepID=A0A839RYU6_9PSEU|nr:methylated-DNA--[protein]-cysteine S-methyltransferase [Prauserella isguenensis]MBB3050636.1 methylated-DNA-[protein]-cysteine S-methyltransferase [Prauserella isguenensis]